MDIQFMKTFTPFISRVNVWFCYNWMKREQPAKQVQLETGH